MWKSSFERGWYLTYFSLTWRMHLSIVFLFSFHLTYFHRSVVAFGILPASDWRSFLLHYKLQVSSRFRQMPWDVAGFSCFACGASSHCGGSPVFPFRLSDLMEHLIFEGMWTMPWFEARLGWTFSISAFLGKLIKIQELSVFLMINMQAVDCCFSSDLYR